MISYIRMENFRRHESTELRFGDEGQIVLIAGQNGAGKSSIIEAIMYALYGEGRHGNRNLERMVRRGGELEGMEVEVEFRLAGNEYRVKRRRDNKITSAVLWANDVALCEGSREVTREISTLFGMDARGFRLAVVAQQKELDGLASMRAGERGVMLARLLRLDALTRARDEARAKFRSERDALRGLGSVEGTEKLEEEIVELGEKLDGILSAKEECEAGIAALVEEIAAGAAIEAAWVAAASTAARAEALVGAARAERGRIERELEELVIPKVTGKIVDLEALREEAGKLEREIAQAEAQEAMASQASMIRGELERVEARLVQIEERKAELADRGDSTALEQEVVSISEAVRLAAIDTETLRTRCVGLGLELGALEASLSKAGSVGAVCEACGQEVSEEHRAGHVRDIEQEIVTKTQESERAKAELGKSRESEGALRAKLGECENRLSEAKAGEAEIGRLDGEIADLGRRQKTYRDQLPRLASEKVDVDALYKMRDELSEAIAKGVKAAEELGLATLVTEQRERVVDSLMRALDREAEAEKLAEGAVIDSDLRTAWTRLETARSAKTAEEELLGALSLDEAVTKTRLSAVFEEKKRAEVMVARRRGLERAGSVASETAGVLDELSTTMSQQIRPALEGAVGELLGRMSDGRFDAVSLDEDYNLSVRDDGALRPLSEFSGGEIDLIALAMRLALSGVVAERHGAGGAGFLILDECFGSQDAERRESIMTALRGLRGSYGQILLISHVGGIEDAADVVVEVSVDSATGVSTASIV